MFISDVPVQYRHYATVLSFSDVARCYRERIGAWGANINRSEYYWIRRCWMARRFNNLILEERPRDLPDLHSRREPVYAESSSSELDSDSDSDGDDDGEDANENDGEDDGGDDSNNDDEESDDDNNAPGAVLQLMRFDGCQIRVNLNISTN